MENHMSKSIRDLASQASEALGIGIDIVGCRAAHYAEETSAAYWLTRADLRFALDCADEYGSDAYSHWCAGSGREMSPRSMARIYG